MPASDLVNLSGLMDDAKCFTFVRQHRWPEGARCPGCDGSSVIRDGCDDTQPHRQRYRCKACASRFDDLTGTVLAGHHQPLPSVPMTMRHWPHASLDLGAGEQHRGYAQQSFAAERRS